MSDTPPLAPFLVVLAVVAALPAASSAALEPPDLLEGEYWSYELLGAEGEPRGDDADANVSVGGEGPNGTQNLRITTSFNRTLRNGSFEVTTRTRVQFQQGDLGVVARESVTIRDGEFQGRPIWSYSRNITSYGEPLPLLPAPSNPGDLWKTDTRARSVVNQTDRVGEGEDANTVESGPRRYNQTLTETLRVEGVENVTVPAGTFETVVVNRTRSDQPGWTVEWWAAEPGYIARWENHAPDGNVTGGAALADWGRVVPPSPDDGLPWAWILGAFAGAAVVGAGLAYGRTRGT